MPVAVIDIDLERPPEDLQVSERYDHALILIRLRGEPMGQAMLSLVEGHAQAAELRDVLVDGAWSTLLTHWLQSGLGWERDRLTTASAQRATVAICTRDLPEDLQRCLQGMMSLPDDGQEVLVIDNCPATDATRHVVSGFPRARYVLEDRPGLNVARNRALREARNEIVAFADHDSVPDPGWLRGLLRGLDDPHVLCVNGLTMPLELETLAQQWFQLYSPFSRGFRRRVFDKSTLRPAFAGKVGSGSNMALRRSAVDRVGPFDETIGLGTPTCSADDTEMFARILEAGYRIVYEPRALSWHRHRRTRQEVRRQLYGYGVGLYAFLTRRLLKGDLDAPLVALSWFRGDQLGGLFRVLLRSPERVPVDLILVQLFGCVVGPWAYVVSRRRACQADGR